ncbi:hypothetical protein FACS1894113_4250 [Alphaproteobacteria bacterium]|nr:hypothetical protein FACS1894113_4250 [Alphaproteobacteria bacterium]
MLIFYIGGKESAKDTAENIDKLAELHGIPDKDIIMNLFSPIYLPTTRTELGMWYCTEVSKYKRFPRR